MFHFLQNTVHSVAAEPNKNQGRVSIQWHEVVLLSLLCLRFFSGELFPWREFPFLLKAGMES